MTFDVAAAPPPPPWLVSPNAPSGDIRNVETKARTLPEQNEHEAPTKGLFYWKFLMPSFDAARQGYINLWEKMAIRPDKARIAGSLAQRIAGNRGRYKAVAEKTGVPWWWIGITHQLESGGDFATHLHNGDSLKARTRQVPAGRPLKGNPPFTWEDSAEDALRMHALDKVAAWTIARTLYEFERYNGFGYIAKRINSPYLWSYSTLYSAGKYVADGKFDRKAVSSQCGAAVLLRTMLDLGLIDSIGTSPAAPVADAAERPIRTPDKDRPGILDRLANLFRKAPA